MGKTYFHPQSDVTLQQPNAELKCYIFWEGIFPLLNILLKPLTTYLDIFFLSVWQSGPSQGFCARRRVSHILMLAVCCILLVALGIANTVSWVESAVYGRKHWPFVQQTPEIRGSGSILYVNSKLMAELIQFSSLFPSPK